MHRRKILVLNPTANQKTTVGIARALKIFDVPEASEIICETMADGPAAIETLQDIDAAADALCVRISDSDADAFVIADFSDPGLEDCRGITAKPVFGLRDSVITCAGLLPGPFGVIVASSVAMAAESTFANPDGRFAGERLVSTRVRGKAKVLAVLLEAGAALRDVNGAQAVILSSAAMSEHRQAMERELGIPVIDSLQAAAGLALGALAGS